MLISRILQLGEARSFSPDLEKARAQLAAVTMLMDDIEPDDNASPQIIHVVSFSEGVELANPDIVEESVRITRYALSEYRRLKQQGDMPHYGALSLVQTRTNHLFEEARRMIRFIESSIPNPYSPRGLYAMMKVGVFPLPWLSACRDELKGCAHRSILQGVFMRWTEKAFHSRSPRAFLASHVLRKFGIKPPYRRRTSRIP